MRKLTQAIARTFIELLGGKLKRNVDDNEFKVVFEGQEYFCTDLDDAIGTAREMAGGHAGKPDAEEYLRIMGVTRG